MGMATKNHGFDPRSVSENLRRLIPEGLGREQATAAAAASRGGSDGCVCIRAMRAALRKHGDQLGVLLLLIRRRSHRAK